MMHNRIWCVGPVASVEELARKLTSVTFTLCTGFYVQGHEDYLFLNDATHEDGAAEFAVVKGRLGAPAHVQIESVTFSWCTEEEALGHIRRALAGHDDENDFRLEVRPRLQTPEQHRRCHLCS